MSEEPRERVLAVIEWLKERDGEHPSHEQIELELAVRLNAAINMYQNVSRELAYIRNTRP